MNDAVLIGGFASVGLILFAMWLYQLKTWIERRAYMHGFEDGHKEAMDFAHNLIDRLYDGE